MPVLIAHEHLLLIRTKHITKSFLKFILLYYYYCFYCYYGYLLFVQQ